MLQIYYLFAIILDDKWKNYKEAKHLHQISENNLTTLRYSKITWYSAINQGQILGQFGGYYLTRVIFELGL